MATYGPNHSLGIQLDTTKGANSSERYTALYLDETFSPVPNGIPGAWKQGNKLALLLTASQASQTSIHNTL